ncbi:MAG: T9SS type A sorting domain-containing protein [Cytophagaceae bacterium]|nr:T9SS type A sorting domain-containing protein [Cytophagaceae bacterium]
MLLKRTLFVIASMLLNFLEVNAQVLETVFGSSNNDEFTSVVKLSDGSYIVSGSVISADGFGGKDIYALRLSPNHDIIWSKIYGGNYDDAAYVSLVNYNGNILLGCSSSSHNNGSNFDLILIEIDLSGNIQWNKSFRTSSYDEIPRKIIKSPNGLALCAMSNAVGTTASPDMLVLEIDSSCDNILWQNLIGSTDFSGDIPSSIILSNLGGFIMVGGTKTSATNYDQVVIRLSGNGLIESHVAFGSIENENTQDVIELPNNDLVLLGNFRSLSGSGLEMALVNMKSDYTFNWIKTYGDFGNKDDRPYAFKKTVAGEYILAGFSYTFGIGDKDLMILKTDNNGVLVSANNYGGNGNEQPFDMLLTNNEAIIVGSSESNSFGLTDSYILRKPISELYDDGCFNVNVFENDLNLVTHTFFYNQDDPNLILGSQPFNQKNILFDQNNILHNKIVKGNIIGSLSNFIDLDIAKVKLSLFDNSNAIVEIESSNMYDSSDFTLSIDSDTKLLIKGEILYSIPPHLLLKYRNGFDSFQMENIVTNKIDAPLQIEPSAFTMVAADVDISDKIRSNDISLLQEVIVKKIEGFPQQLPAELQQDYIDWRFIDQRAVDREEAFKKASQYPYYSSKGYCRDNVPDIPFYLSNQGSCDTSYRETYHAIFLGDLVDGGSGISVASFDNHSSSITLDIDDVHDLGNNTYRVFLNHKLNAQDKFVSLDFALDYDEAVVSIVNTQMTVEDKQAVPQWLYNDYNSEEVLFTSYSMNGYPLEGKLLYVDIQKMSGVPTIEDLGQVYVFVNGTEVPSSIRLRSQTSTGIDIANDVSSFVNLYPNPTDANLTISLPLLYAKDVHIEFLNVIGQSVIVFDNEQAQSEIEMDLSSLPAGLYECMISIEGKATVMKKVIVR